MSWKERYNGLDAVIVNTIYNHTRRGTGTNVEEDKFIGTLKKYGCQTWIARNEA